MFTKEIMEALSFLEKLLDFSLLNHQIYDGHEIIYASWGLSSEKFHTLFFLYASDVYDPLGPSEIAMKINVTRASMTGLIDDLEKIHLLERINHPQDRRKIILQLTDKGRELVENQMPAIHEWISKVNEAFTEEERKKFSLYLLKLSHILADLYPLIIKKAL
jgi:DNA-binding MarR family transcriptional regulator